MEPTKTGYTRRDVWICLLLAALLSLVVLPGLDRDMAWGDDHAAYISTGIALWEGTLDRQAELNYIMHPTQIPAEADKALYYVWGYPAVLAPVYGAIGFDRTDFHTNLYYKLPSAAALSIACAVLYLFFRRRFSSGVSAVAALGICGSDQFVWRVNYAPDTDVFFFLLAALIYLLCELHLDARANRRRIISGLGLGLVLWYAGETRLNGVMFLPFVLLSQLGRVLRDRKQGIGVKRTAAAIGTAWAVYAACMCAARLLCPPVTSNLSDYSRIGWKDILINIAFYGYKLGIWFGEALLRLRAFPKELYFVLGFAPVLLAGVTMLRRGLGELLPYTALTVGAFCGTVLLPYTQPIRYLFPVFPCLIMFFLYGWKDLKGHLSRGKNGKKTRSRLAAALLLVYMLFPGISYLSNELDPLNRVYSRDGVELWNYIRENTAPDAVVFFEKPRMLYLNTQRIGIWRENGHSPAEADYYLCCDAFPMSDEEEAQLQEDFIPLFANKEYSLYQRR